MDNFGLTENEKNTNLHNYNHALFRNMVFFMDAVWEINMLTKTVVILEDRNDPEKNNRQFEFDALFQEYEERYIVQRERETFRKYLMFSNLERMEEEVSFELHLRKSGEPELYNIVLTPAFDDTRTLYSVYLSSRNLQSEVRREFEEYHRQEQFLHALLSNAYFHFSFDLSGDCMIHEDDVTKDGRHLVRELTGSELPVSFDCFVRKWFEACQPYFEQENGKEIFTAQYLKQAYWNKEHLLELEVKQNDLDGSGIQSIMQIFIVMMERPLDKHIHANVIWMNIGRFQKEAIRDNMELRSSNEDLRKSLGQEQQYRLASLSGALLVYNINLTRNLIEEEFYEIVDERRIPMLQLVGLTPPCNFDEFCRRWCETKVSEESRETFLNMFNRQYMLDVYQKGERHLEIEFDTVLGRGIRVTLRNTAFLLEDKDSGDIIAMVNSKDVSSQRAEEKRQRETLRDAYEAANSANSAKTDFLARMSHDIRTPMNAIIGMTAIASRHLGNPERVSECLKEISVSGKYLLNILSEVLDMSKIESGKMQLQEKEFDLSSLLDNILTICRFQCKEKQHNFSVDIPKLEHANVIGDSQRLQQALMNLIDNAIKYTPDGGRIRLAIAEKETNRPNVGCYEFVLEDNGIGMDQKDLENLFEPFIRSEDRRVTKIQGTGLGMPIAKNIVQMMNGTIEVKSELDHGTTVTVDVFLRLPGQGGDGIEQDDGNPASLDALDRKNYGGKRILLVEDNKMNAMIAKEILEMTNLRVEHVWNGKEAVDRIVEVEDGYYDLIFMDIQMPLMDGYEATKAIRAMERSYAKNVPILAMSANAFAEDVQKSKACGMVDHLAKPIDYGQLARCLDNYLG